MWRVDSSFVTRKELLFLDSEMDTSGQIIPAPSVAKARSRLSRTFQSERNLANFHQDSANSLRRSQVSLQPFTDDDSVQ